MPEPRTLVAFMAAALALLVIPGPVILYTIARTLHQGRRAGLASTLGVGLGDFTHVLAATLGLSALLAASPRAFAAVKIAGALYLAYLGLRTLLSPRAPDADQTNEVMPPASTARVFGQGLLVAVLNPRTALFFLAFLPQFVDAGRGDVAAQTLVLGGCFVIAGMLTNVTYTLLIGALRQQLRANDRWVRLRRYVSGTTYVLLSATTLLTH
ncbi:MAG: LysE family translocator [Anaerolineae bacterium]